jgi:hypothetical protein
MHIDLNAFLCDGASIAYLNWWKVSTCSRGTRSVTTGAPALEEVLRHAKI